MGSALTTIHAYSTGFCPDITKASSKDWITMHAELSGLSVVEVERLWTRFQQLGCDEDGVITEQYLRESSNFKDDILMRNLMISIAIEEKVYFHTFLNYMNWAHNATSEDKLKAIFSFFNSGGDIGIDLFSRILKRVYPDKDEETVRRYADIVFNKISSRGDLSYGDFLSLCGGLQDHIDEVLDFTIIPRDLAVEVQRRFSDKWMAQSHERTKDRTGTALVCDESYQELSILLSGTANWLQTARGLGFSQNNIRSITEGHVDDKAKVLALLHAWKDANLEEATCANLRAAIAKTQPELGIWVYGKA